jgi:hypothetical protein
VLRDKYATAVADGAAHHPTMMAALGWAAREAAAGFVAATIFDDLHNDWLASFRDTDRAPGSDEFALMLRTAITGAGRYDTDDLRTRGYREFGTDHRDTQGSFVDFISSLQIRNPTNSEALQSNSDHHSTVGQDVQRRNAPLDLYRIRTEPPTPVAWIWPDVLAADSYVSLSAAPGTGKSILARGIAVDASLGRSHTDPVETVEPAKVLYVDAENGQDWWRDGLDAMGAQLELPNLAVVCFPDLGGLDTAKGAREFLTMVSEVNADLGGVDLVILDTVSRFIEGGENDADTWSQFYRLAVQPLRLAKIAILRLDHLGKDADRGPRGSSHKLSDVDADYRLTADKPGGDDLALTLGKRRRQHFVAQVRLRRRDSPLRHEPRPLVGALGVSLADGSAVPIDAKVAALVAELDRLNIGVNLSRAKALAAYKAAGGTAKAANDVWSAALKFRRVGVATSAQNQGQQT